MAFQGYWFIPSFGTDPLCKDQYRWIVKKGGHFIP